MSIDLSTETLSTESVSTETLSNGIPPLPRLTPEQDAHVLRAAMRFVRAAYATDDRVAANLDALLGRGAEGETSTPDPTLRKAA